MNKILAFNTPHEIRPHLTGATEGLASPEMIEALSREIFDSAPRWHAGQAVYRQDEWDAMLAVAVKRAAEASAP